MKPFHYFVTVWRYYQVNDNCWFFKKTDTWIDLAEYFVIVLCSCTLYTIYQSDQRTNQTESLTISVAIIIRESTLWNRLPSNFNVKRKLDLSTRHIHNKYIFFLGLELLIDSNCFATHDVRRVLRAHSVLYHIEVIDDEIIANYFSYWLLSFRLIF